MARWAECGGEVGGVAGRSSRTNTGRFFSGQCAYFFVIMARDVCESSTSILHFGHKHSTMSLKDSSQTCHKFTTLRSQQSKHCKLRRSRGRVSCWERDRRARALVGYGNRSGAVREVVRLFMRSPAAPARWRRVGRARAPYPIGKGRGAPANSGAARRGAAAAPAPPHPAAQPLCAICPASASHRSEPSRLTELFFAQVSGLNTFELGYSVSLDWFHIVVRTIIRLL